MRNAVACAKDPLSTRIEESVERISTSTRHAQRLQCDADRLSFFSRLLAELRATELRELLTQHAIEPAGTKQMLARLAAEHLTQHDLDQYVAPTGRSARTSATGCAGAAAGQSTLDALFAAPRTA